MISKAGRIIMRPIEGLRVSRHNKLAMARSWYTFSVRLGTERQTTGS
jgi:hypothetical protein